ncbi:MAG: hypothetical protein F6K17_08095 [Okeania sp. SIO3C4]|nr:hypothetical protein [Okeania sp. SIO3C4]
MFVTILGIKPRYLMSFNPTAYCLLPTAYSQGNVARLLRNGIRSKLEGIEIFFQDKCQS